MEVPLAGDAPPTAGPDGASLPGGYVKTRRFRNWKAMVVELTVAVLGFYVLYVTTVHKPEIPGVLAALVGIAALWLLLQELPGISINSEAISMPTNWIPWLPVLPFWRRTVLLSHVRRLTVSAPRFGLQVVKIAGDFGSDKLVFGSKGQRRRFITLIRSTSPGIAVYRTQSLSY
jgi:hypothetical protein